MSGNSLTRPVSGVRRGGMLFQHRLAVLGMLWLAIAAADAELSPYFVRTDTITGILQFSSVIGLLGLGESLVILGGGGGIDLSVGATLSLVAVAIGFIMRAGATVWVAAVLGVGLAAGLGAANGVLVTMLGIPPLVATLATLYAYGGLAVALTQGVPIAGFPPAFAVLGQTTILGIPLQVLLFLLPAYVGLHFMLNYTPFGRHIYLVGDNEGAARLVGVPVERTRLVLYTVSGLLAGLGAVIMNSWLLTARPDAGAGTELMAITIAVLGGFNIFGGEGSLTGAMLATLVIVTLQNGLQLANINQIWQLGLIGTLLIVSVALNQVFVYRR